MKRKGKSDPKWPGHPELPKVMTVQELAIYLRVHPTTIYRLLKQRRIPAFHIGSDWRFNVEAIDRWRLEQQKSGHQ
jgi:excisionase family DNA binding protein